MSQHTESILNKPQVKLVILRRIVGMTVLAVIVFFILLMLIFRSFSVMDSTANAINYSGSERMRTILLGYLGSSYIQALNENNNVKALTLFKMMQKEKKTYTSILSGLTEGNKKMGLIKTIEEQKMTRKIKDTTGEEEQASAKLMKAISNLENLSQEILNASNEQKIGGSELLTALDILQEVSIKNKESIVVLDEHINKFNVSSL